MTFFKASVSGWSSEVGPAAALFALLLAAVAAAAWSRPNLARRLPLGRCALFGRQPRGDQNAVHILITNRQSLTDPQITQLRLTRVADKNPATFAEVERFATKEVLDRPGPLGPLTRQPANGR